MSTYQVTVDYTPTTGFSFDPEEISVDPGNQTIVWIQGRNDGWTFASLSIEPASSSFGTPNVQAQTMTVSDDDEAATTQTYSYQIGIHYGESILYSDPQIINKPPG